MYEKKRLYVYRQNARSPCVDEEKEKTATWVREVQLYNQSGPS